MPAGTISTIRTQCGRVVQALLVPHNHMEFQACTNVECDFPAWATREPTEMNKRRVSLPNYILPSLNFLYIGLGIQGVHFTSTL